MGMGTVIQAVEPQVTATQMAMGTAIVTVRKRVLALVPEAVTATATVMATATVTGVLSWKIGYLESVVDPGNGKLRISARTRQNSTDIFSSDASDNVSSSEEGGSPCGTDEECIACELFISAFSNYDQFRCNARMWMKRKSLSKLFNVLPP